MPAIDANAYGRGGRQPRKSGSSLGTFVVVLLTFCTIGLGIASAVFSDGEDKTDQRSPTAVDENIFEPVPEETVDPAPKPHNDTHQRTSPEPRKKKQQREGKNVLVSETETEEPLYGERDLSRGYKEELGRYALKFGAFRDINNAFKNRDRLDAAGHKVQIVDYGDGYFRVLIYDGFFTRQDALDYKERFGLRGNPMKL